MSRQKLLAASALAALCVLTAFTMQAKAAGQEGMVVVRDAQTGKMRPPTPDELKALRARMPASAASAGATQGASLVNPRTGARGVRLGEGRMVYEVVTRNPDGTLSSQCVHGEDAAADALHHPAAAAHKEHTHEAR